MSLWGTISKGVRALASPIVKSIPVIGPGLGSVIDQSLVNTTAEQRAAMSGGNVWPCPPGQKSIPGGGCIADPAYGQVPITLSNYGGQVTTGGMYPIATSMSAISRVAQLGRGLYRTVTGRVAGVVLPSGAKYSKKRAAALIRKVGFEVAATALGISLYEAAELLLADAQTASRRRRRGITYAQVRNARRTACMVSRLARDLNVKPAPRSRGTCR